MLSLPLAKLSVARDTDAQEQQGFTWEHFHGDLVFVIDTYGARGDSKLIKIVQGAQVRHVIEIESLIKEGESVAREMQARGIDLKPEQLPVSAIVHCPRLAIRWQVANNKTRRAELRFRTNEDFETVVNQLQQIGLRMNASNKPSRKVRPKSPTPKPEYSDSQLANTQGSPSYLPQSDLEGFSSSALRWGPDQPMARQNAMAHASNQQREPGLRPSSATYDREEDNNRTVTPFTAPIILARPDSATSEVLAFSSSSPKTSSDDDRTSTTMRVGLQERPIPPVLTRRELPIQHSFRPLPLDVAADKPPTRPSTGMMGPPPLPGRLVGPRPASSPGIARDSDLPPLPRPTPISRPDHSADGILWAPNPTSGSPGRPITPLVNDFELGMRSSPPGKKENFDVWQSCKIFPSSSPTGPGSATLASAISHPRQDQTPMRSVNTAPSAPESVRNLTSYALQDAEERRAALDQFVYRHLESDDFLALVEDMETCWARAALGMK